MSFKGGGDWPYIFLIDFITCIYKPNSNFSALCLIHIFDYSEKGQKPFHYSIQPLIACLVKSQSFLPGWL